ncbi:hypothetical protein [Methylobacterium aquaticum]|uniref:Uncharacterized protein n=1 Tax=Methylobacterium aquaticum TaxID=270351 RepID=A0A0C6G2M8_9HYPH|nr:hypothetical protein [Methylobacterium aquaticum]BAQ50420.1 hypothetical protein Maq22A_4p60360 [Methylobacterium aquaticum]
MLQRRALLGGAAAALAVATLPLQAAPVLPVRPRRAMTEFWGWLMNLRPRDAAEADRLIRAGIAERLGPLPARFVSPEFDVTVHGYEGFDAMSQHAGKANFRVTVPRAAGPTTEVADFPVRFAES